jgi:hypothetical protein
VAAVGLGVNTDHIGDIGSLNEGAIKHLLTEIVKLIRENTPLDSDGVVGFLSDKAVSNLGEPPDACVRLILPFLYH